jgi:dTDP-4-dehydrorhamnose reductase
MRLLITGASGLLGGRLAELLSREFEVVAALHRSPPPQGLAGVALDLASPESLERAVAEAGAEAVVHAAALADPEACHRDPALAFRINAEPCAALARLARRLGLHVVGLSTDLVFDGAAPGRREDDAPSPGLVYGRSKRQGETALLESGCAAVARVALVCGRGHGPRGTASEAVAWRLGRGEAVRLFTDQFRTPVDPESVAEAVGRILRGRHRGVFHLGGAERLSRFELGRRTASALGLDGRGLLPVEHGQEPLAPPRPADVSLDIAATTARLGWRPRPLEAALRQGRPHPPGHV